MMPIAENGVVDARIEAVLSLAARSPSPEPAVPVRHFAGTFVCCKCGVQGRMQGW